jgi:hypothetical protein
VGVLLQQAVAPFSAASAAKLNVGKSKEWFGASQQHGGADAAAGIVNKLSNNSFFFFFRVNSFSFKQTVTGPAQGQLRSSSAGRV